MEKQFVAESFPANTMTKEGYTLMFQDKFASGELCAETWIAFYLPQWSSREKSQPQYHFKDGKLVLKITEQQQPWCPEFNGEVKVSSLQTGVWAGELGSGMGQHKFNPLCLVREEQPSQFTYTPHYGYIEIRARGIATAANVVALWMIGLEETPEKSAEICIMEIKGENVQRDSAIIGYGLRAFNDPALGTEFYEESFALDALEFHIYAVDWRADKMDFYIDHKKIKTIHQSPQYSMQLMLNIYEVPLAREKNASDLRYPKEFEIDYVRGYKANP